MSLRPRILSALFGILALAGAATQVASCALDTYGTENPPPSKTCASDANCDDMNPCTTDTCQVDGTCLIKAVADGPLTQQTAGDCVRADCMAGEPVTVNDDADIADDNEPCTTDACSGGAPTHSPLVNDTMCTMGQSPGKCLAGVCTVECSPTKPCNDMNPCTEDTCNASLGTCTFVPLDGLPTPGFQEPVGDCKLHICDMGKDAPLDDDADIPVDNNPCTEDLCNAGTPSNPNVAPSTLCAVGMTDVCDGNGACVECVVPGDCVNLPADDDCQQRTCTSNKCGQTFTAMGTPTTMNPAQANGDCQQLVCNGTGGFVSQAFDTDLPDDNNPCTQNTCVMGAPKFPNEAMGFSCGSPLVCDGMGKCVGCNQPTDCVMLPPDDFCKKRTCISQVCGLMLTPAGTDLPTGQTAQDCHTVECDAMGNIVNAVDTTDVLVDGNQCTQDVCSMTGVPSNPNLPTNTACMQSGGTLCNGAGACKKANGATCAAATDCLSAFCVDGVCCNAQCSATCKSCNVSGSVGTCVNVPKASEDMPGCTGANSCDGMGVCKKDDGQTCTATTDCVSNFCVDGVCCGSACTTACRACNLVGSVGVCSNITSGDDNFPMNVCNGANACDAMGNCKLKDGQTCMMGTQCVSGQCFDGVCCNVACGGTCKSCSITGAVGTCSNVAAGQDDSNGVPACTGVNQSCDGMGVCKKENGQSCVGAGECLSNFCVDNVCCNTACSGTCLACNLAASNGTCSNVAAGQDDTGTCTGTNQSCDGGGNCKFEAGQVCSLGASCLSGFCVDSVCCTTACTGLCQACTAAKTGGTTGVCAMVTTGTDPDAECATQAVSTCGTTGLCDGAGACQLFASGTVCVPQTCTGNTQTNADTCNGTGMCIDNMTTNCSPYVCGATACKTTCAGDADCTSTNYCSTTTCVGKKANGQACTAANQCTSGFCADGVCCDTACTGTCNACTATLKGQGTTGTCGPIVLGSDPEAECATQTASTCGTTGSCDGAGACQLFASGTVCVAQTCTGSTQTNADTCNGMGMCIDNMTTNCAPYVCGATACKTMCSADADCTSTNYCSTTTCVGKKANGQACTAANQCTSNFCVDGVCCESTCTGTCKTCGLAGSQGMCVNVPAMQNDPTTCAGVTQACDGAGNCKLENGQGCSMGTSCLSGFCVDGVCCDTACTGTCNACTATLKGQGTSGTCGPIKSGDDPQNECMNGACAGDSTCKSDNGQGCSMGTTCLSGNCVDMVCCDTTCMGLCQACSAMVKGQGTDGTCGPILAGDDPDNECATDAPSTCQKTGFCGGGSTCQLYAMGTVCNAQSCSMGVQTNADTCNGTGTCVDNMTTSCSPYVCGATACLMMCGSDMDCAMGHYCNGGACVLQKVNGVACSAANQCASGNCPSMDGVCCDMACSGLCLTCLASKKGTGMDGTCGSVNPGTDPDNECTGAQNCDATNTCSP